MNLVVISGSIFTVILKILFSQGVTVPSVILYRNISVIFFSLILLRGRNPFKEFPWTKSTVKAGTVRWLSGQFNFILLNLALTLLPLGILNIVHKTTPFW